MKSTGNFRQYRHHTTPVPLSAVSQVKMSQFPRFG